MEEKPSGLQAMGLQWVRHDLSMPAHLQIGFFNIKKCDDICYQSTDPSLDDSLFTWYLCVLDKLVSLTFLICDMRTPLATWRRLFLKTLSHEKDNRNVNNNLFINDQELDYSTK